MSLVLFRKKGDILSQFKETTSKSFFASLDLALLLKTCLKNEVFLGADYREGTFEEKMVIVSSLKITRIHKLIKTRRKQTLTTFFCSCYCRQLLGTPNSNANTPEANFTWRRRKADSVIVGKTSLDGFMDGDDELLETLVKTATKATTPRTTPRERKRTRNADRKSRKLAQSTFLSNFFLKFS